MNRSESPTTWALLAASALVAGCGGGGGSAPAATATSGILSISVNCAPPAIVRLATTDCRAAVFGTGSFSSSVSWSADRGSIDATGRFTAPDSAGMATITATSVEDPTRRATKNLIIADHRPIVDETDDVAGHQVHVLYVVPSDGADRAYDLDGSIAHSVERWNTWFEQETGGTRIRMDTANSELDVSFFRLSRSDAQMNAYGGGLRIQLEYELVAAGFDAPQKIYLVYYDGGSVETPACGIGGFPPSLPGTVAAMFMKAVPANFDCSLVFFAPTLDPAERPDHIGIHELFHTLGMVPGCAPHQANGAHVGDDPSDQMYVGADKTFPPRLDVNHDDYYQHDIVGCPDLADSSFLEPLPPTAEPPPGWPYEKLTPLPCANEALMKSGTGDVTTIEFINGKDEIVYVYWLDALGTRQFIASIDPKEGLLHNTSQTVPFVVTDVSNQCLAIFEGAPHMGRAIMR